MRSTSMRRGAKHRNFARCYPPAADGPRSSVDELDRDGLADDAFFDTALKELLHRSATAVAVVERPVVHVHADEGVCLGPVETAGVLHRMIQSPGAMLQSIRDAAA